MKTQVLKIPFERIIYTLKKHQILIDKKNAPLNSYAKDTFKIHTKNSEASKQSCFILYDGVKLKSYERFSKGELDVVKLFIIENEQTIAKLPQGSSYFFVSCSRKAWACLAAEACNNPQESLDIIAITGTNGKTTTAWITTQILQKLGYKAGYIGTLGTNLESGPKSPLTTPDPDILYQQLQEFVKQGYSFVSLEASSHALSMGKLHPIKFSAAAFTSFSQDHLDYHKTIDEYLKAKLSLFTNYMKREAPCFIHSAIYPLLPKEFTKIVNTKLYSKQTTKRNKNLEHFCYQVMSENLSGSDLCFQIENENFRGKVPFWGEHNQDNFFVSILLVKATTQKVFSTGWNMIKQPPGRMEPINTDKKNSRTVFVDFSHTPDSLEKALINLKTHKSGSLYVTFGCGGNRDRGKRKAMGEIAQKHSDFIIVTNDNPRYENPTAIIQDIMSGIDKKEICTVIPDRRNAIHKALSMMNAKDVLLIAGKGHENYQETNGIKKDFLDKAVVQEYFDRT